ncbi:hypothetical protein AD936_19255 [Gluconobacter japonicus]|nr:hypothetical protein AD936_19255 [Gluconobacter japonicus]
MGNNTFDLTSTSLDTSLILLSDLLQNRRKPAFQVRIAGLDRVKHQAQIRHFCTHLSQNEIDGVVARDVGVPAGFLKSIFL